MGYPFPLAFMANAFSVTILLIVLGLADHRTMAAEVGVVQAATLALLYAFSANARSLILNEDSGVSAAAVIKIRLLLILPLAMASYWLSVGIAGAPPMLAGILIVRRCIEWMGEVHLSEMERRGEQRVGIQYVALQSVLLLVVLFWLIGDFPGPLIGLALWAGLPLFFSVRFISYFAIVRSTSVVGVVQKFLPNLGSTAIIGITVYVFRLLILLVTTKEIAGDLFTAFAIGGATGSIFANALGASIALHEQNSGKQHKSLLLRCALIASLILGIILTLAGLVQLPALAMTGKSFFFWKATGLSMIGGVVMVAAQRIRFWLLQNNSEHDVFGPDVLINILIFTAVPFSFYLFGEDALSALYLASGVMAYLFYFSAKKEKLEYLGKVVWSPSVEMTIRRMIAVLLFFPLFFQLGDGIFENISMVYDSGGLLMNLPIPMAAVSCCAGILLLGTYRRAFLAFSYIFLTCVLMIFSAIILTQKLPSLQQAKFLLLIQLVLPMFALVLGQVFVTQSSDNDKLYARAFFGVLVVVLPVQLFHTWRAGLGYLSPQMGLFSIYQALEYVPPVFVAGYLIALFNLWETSRYRPGLLFLSFCMAMYVAASLSLLSVILFFAGLAVFGWLEAKRGNKKIIFLLMLAVLLSGSYLYHMPSRVALNLPLTDVAKAQASSSLATGGNHGVALPLSLLNVSSRVVERTRYWNFYLEGVTTNLKAFLIGVSHAPDRNLYPSAHNYYLDFIYNFGLIALLPTLFLLGMTVCKIFQKWPYVSTNPPILVLSIIVPYMVIVDNTAKVSMRQPYSGIFIFFLWGVLISKLSKVSKKERDATI